MNIKPFTIKETSLVPIPANPSAAPGSTLIIFRVQGDVDVRLFVVAGNWSQFDGVLIDGDPGWCGPVVKQRDLKAFMFQSEGLFRHPMSWSDQVAAKIQSGEIRYVANCGTL